MPGNLEILSNVPEVIEKEVEPLESLATTESEFEESLGVDVDELQKNLGKKKVSLIKQFLNHLKSKFPTKKVIVEDPLVKIQKLKKLTTRGIELKKYLLEKEFPLNQPGHPKRLPIVSVAIVDEVKDLSIDEIRKLVIDNDREIMKNAASKFGKTEFMLLAFVLGSASVSVLSILTTAGYLTLRNRKDIGKFISSSANNIEQHIMKYGHFRK